ncbi:MAG: ABC transporter substrate-binding protein, partial [Alphaproteobacteria bacterium]|nr:ABC transporter substrate-binding protein [Alphaproteobacteria bacterium]
MFRAPEHHRLPLRLMGGTWRVAGAKRALASLLAAGLLSTSAALLQPALAQTSEPRNGAPSAPAKLQDVRLAFAFTDDIFLAPVVAAEKLEFYAKAGIAVRRIKVRGQAATLEALKAGQADIIDLSGPAAALAVQDGVQLRLVATVSEKFLGWSVIVRADAPVKSLRDLAGKRIGISGTRGLPDLAAHRMARRSGQQFEISAIGAGALVPGLRDNKIEAVLSSALVGLRETAAGRARIIVDLGRDEAQIVVSAYAASIAFMEKQPRALRGFLAATFNAL